MPINYYESITSLDNKYNQYSDLVVRVFTASNNISMKIYETSPTSKQYSESWSITSIDFGTGVVKLDLLIGFHL